MSAPVPLWMGVVNVTPDSFSDGGRFLDPQAAVQRALELERDGAGVIDLGAESTRPGSDPVPPAVQLERLLPVVRGLRAQRDPARVPVSIDTQSAAVAAACLDAGADWINDISGGRADPALLPLAAARRCPLVLMHMQGTPKTMQQQPQYTDVAAEVCTFFRERLAACDALGIGRSNVLLDPGIGFGKTLEQNVALLRALPAFAALGCRVLVGVSRKSLLGALAGEPDPARRTLHSVVAALAAVEAGASVLRVHDVAEHVAAWKVWSALRT